MQLANDKNNLLLNNFSGLLGSDRLKELFELSSPHYNSFSSNSSFPKYNLVKKDEMNYSLELAVAGYDESELNVEMKDNAVIISGKKSEKSEKHDETSNVKYLQKGIAYRDFKISFPIMETIVVNSVDLNNGILSIEFENIIPEHKKPKQLQIGYKR